MTESGSLGTRYKSLLFTLYIMSVKKIMLYDCGYITSNIYTMDVSSKLLVKKLCVEWESTNTGWHINVHDVKIGTHIKCEVNHNGDMEMGIYKLNGWVIYGLNGRGSYGKVSYCFQGICSKNCWSEVFCC